MFAKKEHITQAATLDTAKHFTFLNFPITSQPQVRGKPYQHAQVIYSQRFLLHSPKESVQLQYHLIMTRSIIREGYKNH